MDSYARKLKPVLDVMAAGALLAILLPVIAVAAATVLLTMGAPGAIRAVASGPAWIAIPAAEIPDHAPADGNLPARD